MNTDDNNTELDNTDKKLHISDVSDSISFETKDYENVRVKVGESNISIKTTKRKSVQCHLNG